MADCSAAAACSAGAACRPRPERKPGDIAGVCRFNPAKRLKRPRGCAEQPHLSSQETSMKTLIALWICLLGGLALADGASAQVRLGIGAPITGGSAAFGAQIRQGAEQAADDINAAGGILGQKIVTSVGDDRADPKDGVSVANKFAGDRVKFVVGHFNSGVSMAASEVYRENGMLEITP